MNDPYKVLGVSPNSDDDELKRTYRELVKKYHPDNYQDSPLADLAQEKMSEINAAYDTVVKQRKAVAPNRNQNQSYDGYGGYGGNYGYSSSGHFDDIRRLINMGKILEAQELLEGIPPVSRDGEWYYLKGYVLYTRGFLEDALPYFQKAVEMDPNNPEYRDFYNRIMNARQYGYRNTGYSGSNCSPCSLCTTLACLNMGCGCGPCRFCCI
ncbi:MAG: DnaJ domain-containing protein [Oscillospiraceae bacterium]